MASNNFRRKVINHPLPPKDTYGVTTGTIKYHSDILFPNMLHAKLLRSPFPNAEIKNINTKATEALSGVKMVMTHLSHPHPKGLRKNLYYVGDPVAVVIADDENTALQGCDLIEVEYKQNPFVVDAVEAMKPDSPKAYGPDSKIPNLNTWINRTGTVKFSEQNPITGLWEKFEPWDHLGFGDVEQGFKEADVIVEDGDLVSEYTQAPTIDNYGGVFQYAGGQLTVWTHTQGIHTNRATLANNLPIDFNKVNFITHIAGCSFGGQFQGEGVNYNRNHCILGSQAAIALAPKPVRFWFSREEDMLYSWSRGSHSWVKIGFKKDGTLTTMDMEITFEVSVDGQNMTLYHAAEPTGALLYAKNCKNMRLKTSYVYTNRFPTHGWRGFGAPEASHAVEIVMDEAADRLGMDLVDLQKKNAMVQWGPDCSPMAGIKKFVPNGGVSECVEVGAEKIDWKARRKPPSVKTGVIREGIGSSIMTHAGGFTNSYGSATIKVFGDGTAQLIHGNTETGNGQHTVQTMLVAEILGIEYEKVKLICHDTDSTPFCVRWGGSTGTRSQGMATIKTAQILKDQLLAAGARMLKLKIEEVDTSNGKIFSKTEPDRVVSWAQLLGPAQEMVVYANNVTDEYTASKLVGANFVAVKVDTETGLFTIEEPYRVIMNAGVALNPLVVEGQLLGARHGIEHATGCDCITDKITGRPLIYNWEEYKVPLIVDYEVDPIYIELPAPWPDPDPRSPIPGYGVTPFGAIAIGEGPNQGATAAISNAIYNATGKRLKATPYTPERILRALGKI